MKLLVRASGEEAKDNEQKCGVGGIIAVFFPFSGKGGLSGHMCTYWNMIWQGFESLCFFLSSNCQTFLAWMQFFMYPTTYCFLDFYDPYILSILFLFLSDHHTKIKLFAQLKTSKSTIKCANYKFDKVVII